jgi:hypothetical protein
MTTQTAPARTAGRKNEQRRSPRKRSVMEAWISSPTSKHAERQEVISVDLSKHGVAFDASAPIPKNTFYIIEIGYGEQKIVAEIKTISCRKLCDGLYHVGSEFN